MKGQVIADGPATSDGEISLGKNALIGFMTWEGYNYEDAVLINEKIVRDDVYTSIHIEEYETEARDTKLGPEEITRDIPNRADRGRAPSARYFRRKGKRSSRYFSARSPRRIRHHRRRQGLHPRKLRRTQCRRQHGRPLLCGSET